MRACRRTWEGGPCGTQIVSRDEWLTARKAHLRNEKALTRMRDLVAAERRALPWVKVEKGYVFDAPQGKVSLADLFDGRSQLIVHHLMFHPDWEAGCVGCSFQADHIDGPDSTSNTITSRLLPSRARHLPSL